MRGTERRIQLPVLWVVIAGAHAAAAVYAWRMLPHGFDPGQSRFWINEVVPFAVAALGMLCVFALWRERVGLAALTIAMFPGLHAGIAAAWFVVFPISGGVAAMLAGASAVLLVIAAIAALRRGPGLRARIAIGAVIGVGVGCAIAVSQRGADPQTHPAEPVRALAQTMNPAVTIPPWVRVAPEVAALRIEAGPLQIDLHPLLTFVSRSPDRGWTLLASDRDRLGPSRRYNSRPDDDANATYHYAGGEPAVMRVSLPSTDVLHVEAETVLTSVVYSHLNSFARIEINGHRRLFLAFSAAPDKRIEVTYSEYPVGRPSRFAYLDAASVLHVVEASSGEKGPFTELARGPLAPGAPLAMTLYDEATPVATIELADFATQASTQPSPTAGWGVPENAIELYLRNDRPDATATIHITLAGTSVGRGFDSVGHAPGLYRNRIDIRR